MLLALGYRVIFNEACAAFFVRRVFSEGDNRGALIDNLLDDPATMSSNISAHGDTLRGLSF
jgi:hypothetical protein